MNDAAEVVVVGAGPAAAATACGLRRLGYAVVMIGESRNASVEGVSERTLARLRIAGLLAAAECVRGPGERTGVWGDGVTATSREYIVERSAFDRALLTDAAASGVVTRADWVIALEQSNEGWCVRTRSGDIDCRVVIDARGRRSRGAPLRGPRLAAISQRFQSPGHASLRTVVHPLADGWCWLAEDEEGMRWVQVVGAPGTLQPRHDLSLQIATTLKALPALAASLDGAVAVGPSSVRAAVAKMSIPAPARGMLRVGDAAIAMDPLSGHGLHEALASASVTVAAAHTYLDRDDWIAVEQFVNERAHEVWSRTVAVAAHFYGAQAARIATPFWMQTASAYESLAVAANAREWHEPRVDLRPVLNGHFIEMRRVVVTPERRRGVWQLSSVELAGLVDYFHSEPQPDVAHAAERFARTPAVVSEAAEWLAARGLIQLARQSGAPPALLNRGG